MTDKKSPNLYYSTCTLYLKKWLSKENNKNKAISGSLENEYHLQTHEIIHLLCPPQQRWTIMIGRLADSSFPVSRFGEGQNWPFPVAEEQQCPFPVRSSFLVCVKRFCEDEKFPFFVDRKWGCAVTSFPVRRWLADIDRRRLLNSWYCFWWLWSCCCWWWNCCCWLWCCCCCCCCCCCWS